VILDRFQLTDRVAIVTGAGKGIGRGIALAFAEAGADIVCAARTAADIEATAREVRARGRRALPVLTDVLQTPDLERLVDSTLNQFGRLDVLVNNAGQTLPGGRNEYIPEVFEQSVAINLFGAFRLATACKPWLEKSSMEGGASVVNLASMSSFFSVPIVPGYGAAKAAIVQMTKNLGVAWAGDNIRVNAVAPGVIRTPIYGEADVASFGGVALLNRVGEVNETTDAVLYLATAKFTTGHILRVDGGYVTGRS